VGEVASATTQQPLPLVEGPAALARLAAGLAPPTETRALVELAQGAPADPHRLRLALAAIRSAIPRFPSAVVQAAQALVNLLDVPGTSASAWHVAEAHLVLGQAHAARRSGCEAAAAASHARARFAALGDLAGLARCDLVAGEAAIAEGRYDEALRLLETARLAARQAGDHLSQAQAALGLAYHAAERIRSTEALALAQQAAELAPEAPWLVCRSRIQAADALFSQTRYPEAAAAYAELVITCDAAGWRADWAHVRLMQGLLATQQGDFAAAQAALEAALAVYTAEEIPYYIAVCQRGLAMLNRRLGRYEEALALAGQALATFEGLGHTVAVGRCQHAIGMIYHAWNRYDAAFAAYEAALARYETADLRHEQIAVRANLALILEERGAYHAALDRYERALQDSQALGLTSSAAFCLENIAMLNGRLGRYNEAAEWYRRARRAFRRVHASFDAHICAARQAGMLHAAQSNNAQPARRLLNVARRYFAEQDRQIPLAFCELTLGELAAARRQYRRAVAHYTAALARLERHDQQVDAALCRLMIGEARLAAGEAAAALPILQAAAQVFAANFPDLAARAEHALGKAASASGDGRAAARHWQAAVEHVGVARRGIVTESHAGTFYAARRAIYEDALDGWLALAEPADALAVAEMSKGQVLASLLQQREVLSAAFAGQTPEARALWEKSWAVTRELEALRARWPGAEADGTRNLAALNDGLKRAPADVSTRLGRLSAEQAELFERVRHSAASIEVLDPCLPFSLERFRAVANREFGGQSERAAGWGALAYHLRSDRLAIFWVTPQETQAWVRPLSRLTAAKLAQAVDPHREQRETVYAGRLRGEALPQPPGPALMRSLADLLIPQEIRDELAADRPLLIAPHGLLHYLPFPALLLDDHRPVLEQAQVSYAPTLRAWEAIQDRRRSLEHAGTAGAVLVCGLGEFGDRAASLPHAEQEARSIAGLLGGRFKPSVTLLLGASATAGRLSDWRDSGVLARFDIVHLATHAIFDLRAPLHSRILLADGALAVPDLFRLRLNARLVTLSACQTALSALRPGDELLGLREALLFAGANALLVSLWQVDDASTARLMIAFYRGLARGASPAAALAAAQRELRAAGLSAYHWAPFMLVG
jgi:CHAT domain-containing protein/tetratricopeptide (TPR) repeat protein